MVAERLARELRAALHLRGITLWELARRCELDIVDVATALGGTRLLPADLLDSLGQALDLQLSMVPASGAGVAANSVGTVVDAALGRLRRSQGPNGDLTVLALGFEETLLSNAVSMVPRPGLLQFLDCAQRLFPRLVMFTAVNEETFRRIAAMLARDGAAPRWFSELEYVQWKGPTKDLRHIIEATPSQVLLVDDLAHRIHDGQESQWVPISAFEPPFNQYDDELSRVLQAIVDRLTQQAAPRSCP